MITRLENPLLKYQKDILNDFTLQIKNECMSKGSCLCELRNGDIVRVIYKERLHDEEDVLDFFVTQDYSFLWKLNGESVTNAVYDIASIIES